MSRTNSRARFAALALFVLSAAAGEAQQGIVTIRFVGPLTTPTSYTESGLTVRTLGTQLLLNNGVLTNQLGANGPYRFDIGGAPFTVLGLDVVTTSGPAAFVTDQGRILNVSTSGPVTFPAAAWTNVAFFDWRQVSGTMRIDNLRIQLQPQDGIAPVVSIASPADGAFDARATLPIAATVRDDSPCTVWTTPAAVEGALSIPASPGGADVALGVPMPSGDADVVVTVWARDQAGNVGLAAVTVHHDSTPPALEIRSPASGSVSGSADVAVAFDVGDSSPVDVAIEGLTWSFPAGGGGATFVGSFEEGFLTIVATAADRAGNSARTSASFVVDRTGPIVSIDAPVDGELFGPSASAAPLSFTIDDATAVDYATSPAALAGRLPSGGGIVSGAVPLVEGANRIEVSATDEAGHATTAAVHVVLDTTPPDATLLFPTGGEFLRGDATFAVLAADPLPGSGVGSVRLSIDDGAEAPLAPAPDGTWELRLSTAAIADGAHRLAFRVVDGLGSSRVVAAEVVVDNTPPEVRVASPVDGACLGDGDVATVEASDATAGLESVALDVGGSRVAESGASPLEVVLDPSARPDGPLSLRAVAVDRAGNVAEASIVVIVDAAPPRVSIESPADGGVVSGVFTVAVQLVDAALARVEFRVDGRRVAVRDRAPYSVAIDSRASFDGPLALEVVATDGRGQVARDAIRVLVDNMSFALEPHRVRIPGRPAGRIACGRDGRSLVAVVEAPNLALLTPVEQMDLRLLLPDGTTLRPLAKGRGKVVWARTDADGDGVPELRIAFDRLALVHALQRSLRPGRHAQPPAFVPIELVARRDDSIGTFLLAIDR